MVNTLDEEKICSRISGIVASISLRPSGEKISYNDDLFESGTLDSVALIGLVTKIEDEFKVKVSATEYNPENFMTTRGMARMVYRLLERDAQKQSMG